MFLNTPKDCQLYHFADLNPVKCGGNQFSKTQRCFNTMDLIRSKLKIFTGSPPSSYSPRWFNTLHMLNINICDFSCQVSE